MDPNNSSSTGSGSSRKLSPVIPLAVENESLQSFVTDGRQTVASEISVNPKNSSYSDTDVIVPLVSSNQLSTSTGLTLGKSSSADPVEVPEMCDLCSDFEAIWTCDICDNKILCQGCDNKWHGVSKRRQHNRTMMADRRIIHEHATPVKGLDGVIAVATSVTMAPEISTSVAYSPTTLGGNKIISAAVNDKPSTGWSQSSLPQSTVSIKDEIALMIKSARYPPNDSKPSALLSPVIQNQQKYQCKFCTFENSKWCSLSFDAPRICEMCLKAQDEYQMHEFHSPFYSSLAQIPKPVIAAYQGHSASAPTLSRQNSSQMSRGSDHVPKRDVLPSAATSQSQYRSKFVDDQESRDEIYREKQVAKVEFKHDQEQTIQPQFSYPAQQVGYFYGSSVPKISPADSGDIMLGVSRSSSYNLTSAGSDDVFNKSQQSLVSNPPIAGLSRTAVSNQSSNGIGEEGLGLGLKSSEYTDVSGASNISGVYNSKFAQMDEVELEKKRAQAEYERKQSQLNSTPRNSDRWPIALTNAAVPQLAPITGQRDQHLSQSLHHEPPSPMQLLRIETENECNNPIYHPNRFAASFGQFYDSSSTVLNTNVKKEFSKSGRAPAIGPPLEQLESIQEQMASIQKQTQLERMQSDGRAVIAALKASESLVYVEGELQCMLRLCGNQSPVDYFRSQWIPAAETLVRAVRERQIVQPTSSPILLARLCLALANGDTMNGIKIFQEKWKERVDEAIKSVYGTSHASADRKYVELILSHYDGDTCLATDVLIRERFLPHIWESLETVAPPALLSEARAEENGTMRRAALVDGEMYQNADRYLSDDLMVVLRNNNEDYERKVRLILCEASSLKSWMRSEYVMRIIDNPTLSADVYLADIVAAASTARTFNDCCRVLRQDCAICYSDYPTRMIMSLSCCQCKVCHDCMRRHFEVVIRERYVRNLVCPVCQLPEIIDTNSEETETHFQFLLLRLHDLLTPEVFELFQMKLRDWNLMMDPNFVWCSSTQCKNGFLIPAENDRLKVQCLSCDACMCRLCKKPWEDQHATISCEDFVAWKEANDPERQQLGLARHLEENGIECPQCKSRYSLAKGGCMHFTCIQCRHDFCSGCAQPFKKTQCTLLKSCAKAGLHCHHPRNCLFYLRDQYVSDLQKLLKDNKVEYDTKPPPLIQTQGDTAAAAPSSSLCSVMEQKQTQTGFKDEACGKEVPENYAGLCEIHFKEYLVSLINKHNIDPVQIMDDKELGLVLTRVDKKVPKINIGESAERYHQRLLKMVQEQVPLPIRRLDERLRPRGAGGTSNVGVIETDGESSPSLYYHDTLFSNNELKHASSGNSSSQKNKQLGKRRHSRNIVVRNDNAIQ